MINFTAVAMEDSMVVAWAETAEFAAVAEWVLGGQAGKMRRAKRTIKNWQLRCDRLPAGAETSLYLIEAVLAVHDDDRHADSLSLILASAINRFLNLVAHIAERKFDLSKYYDVAQRFSIPDWVVRIRHETTHGAMPGLETLKMGLDYCMEWIRQNYWHEELIIIRTEMETDSQHPIRSLSEYSSLHDLLDCYMYLKLYSIWGTERVGHLRDQVELYQHVAKLWKDVGNTRVPSTSKKSKSNRTDVDQVLISDAVNVLRGDLDRRLKKCCESGDEEQTAEILAFTLIHDQLLFPSDEFVRSVKEGGEDGGKIPKALVRIWVPVLNVVASRGMSPELCRGLMATATAKDTDFRSDCAAEWLNLILAPLPEKEGAPGGKKRKDRKSNAAIAAPEPPGLENDSAKWKTLLEETLMSPNRASLGFLPQLFRMQRPRLAAGKEKSLLALMGSHVGERKASAGKEGADDAAEAEMRTLADVVPDGGVARWTSVNTCAPEWRVCPLGALPGRVAGQDLDLDSGWMEDELDEMTTAKESPYFEVAPLDWQALVTDEEERRSRAKKKCPELDSELDGENVPAFYRSNGSGKRPRR